ncbi:LPXTG cell wall anchor domain-containing protein [Candidatus Enterococcus murrayae]|uniref:LPXTG cell wall anchor domain-containing protein n=1 Tax=Candidatus Enterococcus murrayae TaxID=2815321 RepID=A0ABS3HGW2_9ENTE|nr:LPXTG cell wall anchor domain-containing protein [Enterococcus sp. MJM16]
MIRKKGLLLMVVFCLLNPIIARAEGQSGTVGIGFRESQKVPKETPEAPIENVLPMTTGRNYYQARGKSLPQTGTYQNHWFQYIGLFCLISWFWLFLFFRFKEDEESEEGRSLNEGE